MNRATTATLRGKPLKGLVLALGTVALSSSAYAAGIDSHAYTCPELQRLILTNRFIFINNPDFQDFVVFDISYCSSSGILQLRTVPTKDIPECPVNYCLPPRNAGSGD